MRAILLILIVAVVALVIAFATGFLKISQTRDARAPDISASANGVAARGGQPPTFDIETGSVSVGTTQRNVAVPTVRMNPANRQAQQPDQNVATNAN